MCHIIGEALLDKQSKVYSEKKIHVCHMYGILSGGVVKIENNSLFTSKKEIKLIQTQRT